MVSLYIEVNFLIISNIIDYLFIAERLLIMKIKVILKNVKIFKGCIGSLTPEPEMQASDSFKTL